jgi:hypothetical protein
MKEHPLILGVALLTALVVALTGVEFSCIAQTRFNGGTALQPAGTGFSFSKEHVESDAGWFNRPVDASSCFSPSIGGSIPAGDVNGRTGDLYDSSRLTPVFQSEKVPFLENAGVYSNYSEFDTSDVIWRGMCFYLDQELVDDPTLRFLGAHLLVGSGLHPLSTSTPFSIGPESECMEPSANKDHSFGARLQWHW